MSRRHEASAAWMNRELVTELVTQKIKHIKKKNGCRVSPRKIETLSKSARKESGNSKLSWSKASKECKGQQERVQ